MRDDRIYLRIHLKSLSEEPWGVSQVQSSPGSSMKSKYEWRGAIERARQIAGSWGMRFWQDAGPVFNFWWIVFNFTASEPPIYTLEEIWFYKPSNSIIEHIFYIWNVPIVGRVLRRRPKPDVRVHNITMKILHSCMKKNGNKLPMIGTGGGGSFKLQRSGRSAKSTEE